MIQCIPFSGIQPANGMSRQQKLTKCEDKYHTEKLIIADCCTVTKQRGAEADFFINGGTHVQCSYRYEIHNSVEDQKIKHDVITTYKYQQSLYSRRLFLVGVSIINSTCLMFCQPTLSEKNIIPL